MTTVSSLIEINQQQAEQIKQLTAERDALRLELLDALEKIIHLDDTSYLTQNWGLSSEQIKVIEEALKGQQ